MRLRGGSDESCFEGGEDDDGDEVFSGLGWDEMG